MARSPVMKNLDSMLINLMQQNDFFPELLTISNLERGIQLWVTRLYSSPFCPQYMNNLDGKAQGTYITFVGDLNLGRRIVTCRIHILKNYDKQKNVLDSLIKVLNTLVSPFLWRVLKLKWFVHDIDKFRFGVCLSKRVLKEWKHVGWWHLPIPKSV